MKPYLEKFASALAAWRDAGGEAGARERFAKDVAAWEKQVAAAEAAGDKKRRPRKPRWDRYTDPADKHQPGGMFNGLVAPIARLRVRGVLFYQGENNSFGESWKPFPGPSRR